MPGRIAAARISPRKTSASTIFTFQSATTPTITATATRVVTNARRATSAICGLLWPRGVCRKRRREAVFGEAGRSMLPHDEEVCFEARRHGAVLAGPLTQAVVLALRGGILLAEPWPLPVPGAVLMVVAAGICLRAVWR